MARINTASAEMIKDFAELKKQGIATFICTTWNANGKRYEPVIRHTAQGVSAYANRMYNKYGDGVTVEVGYFDKSFDWHTYCTYGA